MPQTASKRRNLLAACKDTSKSLGCDPAKKAPSTAKVATCSRAGAAENPSSPLPQRAPRITKPSARNQPRQQGEQEP